MYVWVSGEEGTFNNYATKNKNTIWLKYMFRSVLLLNFDK